MIDSYLRFCLIWPLFGRGRRGELVTRGLRNRRVGAQRQGGTFLCLPCLAFICSLSARRRAALARVGPGQSLGGFVHPETGEALAPCKPGCAASMLCSHRASASCSSVACAPDHSGRGALCMIIVYTAISSPIWSDVSVIAGALTGAQQSRSIDAERTGLVAWPSYAKCAGDRGPADASYRSVVGWRRCVRCCLPSMKCPGWPFVP
jgi:hypothetical protein